MNLRVRVSIRPTAVPSSSEYRRVVGFPCVTSLGMAPSSFPRSGALKRPRAVHSAPGVTSQAPRDIAEVPRRTGVTAVTRAYWNLRSAHPSQLEIADSPARTARNSLFAGLLPARASMPDGDMACQDKPPAGSAGCKSASCPTGRARATPRRSRIEAQPAPDDTDRRPDLMVYFRSDSEIAVGKVSGESTACRKSLPPGTNTPASPPVTQYAPSWRSLVLPRKSR